MIVSAPSSGKPRTTDRTEDAFLESLVEVLDAMRQRQNRHDRPAEVAHYYERHDQQHDDDHAESQDELRLSGRVLKLPWKFQ